MQKSVFNTLAVNALLFLFLSTGITAQAQTTTKQNGPATAPAREGTYQLIFNSREVDKDIQLSPHELQAIEALRKDNEVVYAFTTYSDDIRVKILPRNAISAKDFKAAEKKYYKVEHPYEEYANIRYVELN